MLTRATAGAAWSAYDDNTDDKDASKPSADELEACLTEVRVHGESGPVQLRVPYTESDSAELFPTGLMSEHLAWPWLFQTSQE